jgi:hypothetical protein
MNKRIATGIGVAVLGGSMIAGAVPALAAVTNSSPPIHMSIHIDSPDKISARGAAVDVTLTVKCPKASYNAGVSVAVSERSGNQITTAYGQAQVFCTGSDQPVDLYLQASGKPFVVGSASVSASLWDDSVKYGSNQLDASGTVKFVK